jgi:hypothetical protein
VPLVLLMLNQHSTWLNSYAETFPILTAAMVLVGWTLTQHLYGISKKVKGFKMRPDNFIWARDAYVEA